MKIEQKNSGGQGIFLTKDNEKTVGEMTYIWTNDNCFIINHTEVSPNYQGEGVGRKMVKSAVDYARKNNFTIIPMCSFARSEFDRHPDYSDVREK